MTVQTTTFDPTAFEASTRSQWQNAAEAWHRWGGFIGDWLGDATEAMVEMAGIGAGDRVLDVAAGPASSPCASPAGSARPGTCS